MTMLEKYLMKLFTFTLYFIIIYVNVTAVNALIKRELFQKRADWDPSTSFIKCHNLHDKSKHCDKRDWTEEANYRFTTDVIKTQSNLELDDCFNMCWEDDNCYAVSREKGGNRSCIFLGRKYESEYDKRYNSYIARCCKVKDPGVTSPVQPPKRIVTTAGPPLPESDDLPFIHNINDLCYERYKFNAEYSPSSPGLTWYFIEENIDFAMSPYTDLTNTNTQACQRKCARDTKCRAVSVEWNGNVCHFYNHFNNKKSTKNQKQIFFIKFKCEINYLWKRKNYKLLHTANYHPLCEEISEVKLTVTCKNLFWLFFDQMKYDFPASATYDLIEAADDDDAGGSSFFNLCLDKCLNDKKPNCFAVSIDHSQRKCYIYTGLTDDSVVKKTLTQQSSWSTYKLRCCDNPKLE